MFEVARARRVRPGADAAKQSAPQAGQRGALGAFRRADLGQPRGALPQRLRQRRAGGARRAAAVGGAGAGGCGGRPHGGGEVCTTWCSRRSSPSRPHDNHVARFRNAFDKRVRAAKYLDQEPTPPGNPVLKLDNMVLSAHFAGPTWDNHVARFRNGFDNVGGPRTANLRSRVVHRSSSTTWCARRAPSPGCAKSRLQRSAGRAAFCRARCN